MSATPDCSACHHWCEIRCTHHEAWFTWGTSHRVTAREPETTVPATECPGFDPVAVPAPVPAPAAKPTPKRRASAVPGWLWPWSLPGETSPAGVASRIAREAVDALAPLRQPGEGVKEVLKRLDRSNAVLCRRRDEAVEDAQTARAERDQAKAQLADVRDTLVAVRAENDRLNATRKDDLDALNASRRSLAGARETIDGANKVLDALGAGGGLLADRIRRHEVLTSAAMKALRTERDAALASRDAVGFAIVLLTAAAFVALVLSLLVGGV